MGYNWVSILLVLVTTYGVVHSAHFRGGSMSWRPVGNNQIELNYRLGYTAHFESTEGDVCTEDAIVNRDPLNIRGSSGQLKCEACPEVDPREFDWICDGIDRDEDSAWGHYTGLYDIPQQQFEISNQGCCWIDLQSPIGTSGAKGWKMLAHVDITPHPRTGRINSSPVAASVPLEKYYRGCEYTLRIAASDPDNDEIRCRYADKTEGECHSTHTKACGPATDGLRINSRNCIMYFNTADIGEGYHAVNAIIEDYAKPFNRKSDPLSKVSLLFLMEVAGESETCAKPNIIKPPPKCMSVRPGDQTTLVVKADPGDPSKPIVKIRAQGPSGMVQSSLENDPESPGRKRKTLTWIPTEDHLGQAWPVSYSALDNEGYTSGSEFTFIHVSDEDPFQVDLDNTIPAPGSTIDRFPWPIKVAFNREIIQPENPTFIRLVDADTNEIIYEVDVSQTSSTVQYRGSKVSILIDRPNSLLFTDTRAKLQLDEGVAIPADGRGCNSQPAEWDLLIREPDQPTPTPFTPDIVNPVECNDNTMEIVVPDNVKPGEKCFLHLADSVTVTRSGINTPYKLCCPTTCG